MSTILVVDGKSADMLNVNEVDNQEDFSNEDSSSSDLENDDCETEVNSLKHFNYITIEFMHYKDFISIKRFLFNLPLFLFLCEGQ